MIVKIEDKELTLEYSNRELLAIEMAINKPIIKILQDENELGKLGTMYTIVHCGLKNQVTFDYLLDNFDIENLNNVIEGALKLVMAAFETGVKKKVVGVN